MYTSEEIKRISGSKLAVQGRRYIETNGDVWIGTSDNRLKKLYTKDKTIGVELEGTDPIVNLRDFLKNLQLPLIANFQTEVDFGETLYVNQKEFTITNSKVKEGSIISCSVAYDAPTGKDLDELEMDTIEVKAGDATKGSFKVLVTGTEGSLHGKFKINYSV